MAGKPLQIKLNNPVISKGSHIENAVVERIIDVEPALDNADIGRVWFNTSTKTYRFLTETDNATKFVDEFLSKFDLRPQTIKSALTIQNDFTVEDATGIDIIKVDTVTKEVNVNGNMVVSGDFTVLGSATKLEIQSETMTVADNTIVLNSNLTSTDDPTLLTGTDSGAGILSNRGIAGIYSLVYLVEGATIEDAYSATTVYNPTTSSFELHKIIDSLTLATNGTNLINYSGYVSQYENVSDPLSSNYTFTLPSGTLDNTLTLISSEIDNLKNTQYNDITKNKIGEISIPSTKFTITHNLNTVYVDVKVQVHDPILDIWMFDLVPVQVLDANTIIIELSDPSAIRYIITPYEGTVATVVVG